ncbi:MAG TPA: TAXI family TRAP transporter solute-binding subunit [Xanthobacteraceae bacterium]|nr:TAXI family TRAP transporter solute-binding subunit [Xanthobacteraceae bacterium]
MPIALRELSARLRTLLMRAGAIAVVFAFSGGAVLAQTYGFATLPPGTLNHTTASAVAKVLKEKAGLNVLVQPTAGDQVIIPMVGRAEAELGISNIMEAAAGFKGAQKDIRIIAAVHALRTPFFVRKDSGMRTIADLKGKRVALGYSAMRTINDAARAMLATAGLTENDVKPVLVPNVVRSADDFVSGAADMFYFAFGAPKVREVDATVGGIRALEMDVSRMGEARKIMAYGYATDVAPGPVFIGVEKPMKVYTFDNVIFTHAKTPDDFVYRVLATLDKEKAELVAVQPVLREFSPAFAYKQYDIPYHPGAVKFYKERNIQPSPLP